MSLAGVLEGKASRLITVRPEDSMRRVATHMKGSAWALCSWPTAAKGCSE